MRYFDIGVNLSSEQFAKDRADVICRAQSAGIENMLLIGSNIDDSRQAIALAHTFNLTASAGIHPHDAKTAQGNYCETIASLASDSAVVAIGECGLDYNRDFSPREKQREVFAAQVALANKLNKPLYMHQRDAHQDFLAIVKEAEVPGVVHCFTDSEQALEAYLELGFYIDSESYEFLEYEEEGNSWIAVADPELRPRNLPEWVSVELARDDDIKELPVPEDSEEKKPLLVFFSSGESTEFTLSFFVDGAGKSGYEISSNGYQAIALITPENPDEP